LLAAGLLDELHLLVHPIAVRAGMRLFDEGESRIPLKLLSSQAFSTGVLNLVYAPDEAPPPADTRTREATSRGNGEAGTPGSPPAEHLTSK
jgi:hypothetical protein